MTKLWLLEFYLLPKQQGSVKEPKNFLKLLGSVTGHLLLLSLLLPIFLLLSLLLLLLLLLLLFLVEMLV